MTRSACSVSSLAAYMLIELYRIYQQRMPSSDCTHTQKVLIFAVCKWHKGPFYCIAQHVGKVMNVL